MSKACLVVLIVQPHRQAVSWIIGHSDTSNSFVSLHCVACTQINICKNCEQTDLGVLHEEKAAVFRLIMH